MREGIIWARQSVQNEQELVIFCIWGIGQGTARDVKQKIRVEVWDKDNMDSIFVYVDFERIMSSQLEIFGMQLENTHIGLNI